MPHDDAVTARRDWLAEEFERHRSHLRAVAYRMLGSVSEADDVVQEAWLRLDRGDPGGTEDMRGWLTVVVGRLSLDALRRRKSRQERRSGSWLPEPIVRSTPESEPEHQAVMADSVGLAMLVVLESLTPPERLGSIPTSSCESMVDPTHLGRSRARRSSAPRP